LGRRGDAPWMPPWLPRPPAPCPQPHRGRRASSARGAESPPSLPFKVQGETPRNCTVANQTPRVYLTRGSKPTACREGLRSLAAAFWSEQCTPLSAAPRRTPPPPPPKDLIENSHRLSKLISPGMESYRMQAKLRAAHQVCTFQEKGVGQRAYLIKVRKLRGFVPNPDIILRGGTRTNTNQRRGDDQSLSAAGGISCARRTPRNCTEDCQAHRVYSIRTN